MTYEKLVENLHSSITVFIQSIIEDRKVAHPGVPIEFVDWEAHANIHELPDTDLIGPTALALTEDEPQFFSGSTTIGVSTFSSDKNLFRLRNFVGRVFNQIRPGSKIPLYDQEACVQIGWIHVVGGTAMLPMTRADARPLQFVQCNFIFDPTSAAD